MDLYLQNCSTWEKCVPYKSFICDGHPHFGTLWVVPCIFNFLMYLQSLWKCIIFLTWHVPFHNFRVFLGRERGSVLEPMPIPLCGKLMGHNKAVCLSPNRCWKKEWLCDLEGNWLFLTLFKGCSSNQITYDLVVDHSDIVKYCV